MTGPNVSVPLGKNKLVQTNNSQTAAASDGSCWNNAQLWRSNPIRAQSSIVSCTRLIARQL